MPFNWEYMKHKQIYFVEINDKILKFNGFDDLEEWVKKQKKGTKWKLNCVAAIMEVTKK